MPVYDIVSQWALRSDGPDLNAGTIKVALVTSGYTFSAAHDFFDDIGANQVSGTGYTAGGATVGTTSVTRTAGVAKLIGGPVTWAQEAGGFQNAAGMVVYRDSGVAGTSELLRYQTFAGGPFGNVNGPLTINWDVTGGILQGEVNPI